MAVPLRAPSISSVDSWRGGRASLCGAHTRRDPPFHAGRPDSPSLRFKAVLLARTRAQPAEDPPAQARAGFGLHMLHEREDRRSRIDALQHIDAGRSHARVRIGEHAARDLETLLFGGAGEEQHGRTAQRRIAVGQRAFRSRQSLEVVELLQRQQRCPAHFARAGSAGAGLDEAHQMATGRIEVAGQSFRSPAAFEHRQRQARQFGLARVDGTHQQTGIERQRPTPQRADAAQAHPFVLMLQPIATRELAPGALFADVRQRQFRLIRHLGLAVAQGPEHQTPGRQAVLKGEFLHRTAALVRLRGTQPFFQFFEARAGLTRLLRIRDCRQPDTQHETSRDQPPRPSTRSSHACAPPRSSACRSPTAPATLKDAPDRRPRGGKIRLSA